MGLSSRDGPSYDYGNMAAIPISVGGAVPDPNFDAGPNAMFQGSGLLDMRVLFQKDMLQGFPGRQPVHYSQPILQSIGQIPAALGTANIAALANVVSGTAMTLAGATLGIALNIPIVPFGVAGLNGATPVTPAIALDFGFAFGNVTSGSTSIVVANAFMFSVGMPLVIAGVGNAGATIPLLTYVASITDTTHIVVADTPLATNSAAPIGTGNVWNPSTFMSALGGIPRPTAAQPWLAGGPGVFLDSRQAIGRGLQINGSASGTGGTFTVRGYDLYGMAMTETITVGAGAVVGWGVKAWKYITSVTPNFTDAHNYSVGTSDVFGFNYRAPLWENTEVAFNATYMSTSAGYVAPLSLITAASATTADVRGTIQVSTNGGGSPIASGAAASNGTVSGLLMSGRRLMMQQNISVDQALASFPGPLAASAVNTPNAAALFGNFQF